MTASPPSNSACPHCGKLQYVPTPVASTTCAACRRLFRPVPTRDELARPALFKPIDGVRSLARLEGSRPARSSHGHQSDNGHRHSGTGSLKRHLGQRVVHCFDCGFAQSAPLSASHFTCARCHTLVPLHDIDIHDQVAHPTRTCGRVHIHLSGSFVGSVLKCGQLDVDGRLEGNAVCTGLTTIRNSGNVIGNLDTAHLVVEPHTRVRFLGPVRTRSAEIHGTVEADIECSGPVIVSRHGSLAGSLVAANVQVDPGGSIIADTSIRKPPPKSRPGRNPTTG